jgi:hypothetical protein
MESRARAFIGGLGPAMYTPPADDWGLVVSLVASSDA